jgi:hypothetical protein
MLKILPIKKAAEKIEPRFDLIVTIGYGEHCCDTFTKNSKTIDDKKAKKAFDSWNYITEKEAEECVKLIERALKDVDHIVLNEGITDFWCEGMKKEDIKALRKFYSYHESLFSPEVEHNWYGIVGACIKYLDEEGNWHDVEVV